jgi:hypothetical protein
VELNLQYIPQVDQEVAWQVTKEFLYTPEKALHLSHLLLKETDPGLYEYGYKILRHQLPAPTQEELEEALQSVPAHANLKHVLRIHEEREAAGMLYLHTMLVAQAEKDYLGGRMGILPQHDMMTVERIWRENIKYSSSGLEHMTEHNKDLFHYMDLVRDYYAAPRFQVGAVLTYGMLLEMAKDPRKIEKKKEKKGFN